jgi:hypothetical protein
MSTVTTIGLDIAKPIFQVNGIDAEGVVLIRRQVRRGQVLPPGGGFYIYGAYKENGVHMAPSNEAFDANLRHRNPEWGVRDLKAVAELAGSHGLTLVERILMPANNFSLVFHR